MPINRISFFVLWLSSAALILCFADPAAVPRGFVLIPYVLLFVSTVLLDMPLQTEWGVDLAFWGIFALLIYSILAPITINRTGLIEGHFLVQVAPASHVLLIAAASLMPRRRSLYCSPLLIAGLVLAASPAWAVPLLSAAHKLEGESAMKVLLYWLFYLPMGLYAIALSLLRYFIPSVR